MTFLKSILDTHVKLICVSKKGFIPEAKGEVTLTETLGAEVGGTGP